MALIETKGGRFLSTKGWNRSAPGFVPNLGGQIRGHSAERSSSAEWKETSGSRFQTLQLPDSSSGPAPRFARFARKPYFYNHAPFGWRSANLENKSQTRRSRSRNSLLLSELVFENEHSILVSSEAQVEK